jgi:glycosyltransferase involved in cell wall biosynthesis
MFPPESMGGAHRWDRLARNLPEEVEPHILTPPPILPLGTFERSFYPWKTESNDGLSITRLWTYQPTDGDWTGIGRILYLTVFALFASLYVCSHWWRYDCIVSFIGPHSTLLPGFVGRLFGRSWIIDIDDMWIDNAADLGFVPCGSIAHRAVEKIEEIAFDTADSVTVITQTMADQYSEKHGIRADTFTIVPNGVDLDQFAPPDGNTVNRSQIVYTGKLGRAQALEPFIRGFSHLSDEYELLIVGAGDRREELEKLIERLNITDRVSLNGPVDRAEIPQILQSAALALVPLKTEYSLDYARPTKLLEAMAAGTPYVASRVVEIEAVAADSEAGKAVKNEPKVITDAMSEVLVDEERRSEMGCRGTRFIADNHRWDVLGDRAGSVILAAT